MKMKNKLLLILSIFTASTMLFAQEDDQISLPDVTTEVASESLVAEIEVMPSFEDVLEFTEDSTEIVPQLPDVQIQEKTVATEVVNTAEKSIYAEGKVGGGYPNIFLGDFSIYRLNGNSPFNLSFKHDSVSGFEGNSLVNGYFDRQTSMAFDKEVIYKDFLIDFGGSYETLGNGFQNKVDNISAINSNTILGYSKFNWSLPYGFTLGANLDFDFYDRYEDIVNPNGIKFEKLDWINPGVLFDVSPGITAKWEGHGFTANFSGTYWYNKDFSSNFIVTDTLSDGTTITPNEINSSHRGEFLFGLKWVRKDFDVYASVAAVIGSQLNIDGNGYIVPFTVGMNYSFPTYFSNRNPLISVEGGLNSYRNSVMELEKKYKFTGASVMPTETSDWYGKIKLSIPLKENFTGSAEGEYRQTAFRNGTWTPLYNSENLVNGIYGYDCREIQFLTTNFEVTFHQKIFSATLGWHSNWMDVPALESSQMLKLLFSFQNYDSKMGINIYGNLFFGDAETVMQPVFGLEGFIRITPALRIVVNVDDAIQLFSNQQRTYAGQYDDRGGSASILLKFFF